MNLLSFLSINRVQHSRYTEGYQMYSGGSVKLQQLV